LEKQETIVISYDDYFCLSKNIFCHILFSIPLH